MYWNGIENQFGAIKHPVMELFTGTSSYENGRTNERTDGKSCLWRATYWSQSTCPYQARCCEGYIETHSKGMDRCKTDLSCFSMR